MNKPRRQFEYESVQDRESIVRYLKALADGFEKGRLSFSDKNGEVELEPRGLIAFEVRASKKNERTSVSLSFRWRHVADSGESDAGPLFITAGEE